MYRYVWLSENILGKCISWGLHGFNHEIEISTLRRRLHSNSALEFLYVCYDIFRDLLSLAESISMMNAREFAELSTEWCVARVYADK